MGVLVQLSDFENAPNAINSNEYQDIDLQAFIDEFEKPYLCKILGIELAEALLADSGGGTPVNPLFVAIYDPLQILYRQKIRYSNGLKSILKGFIRAEYLKSIQTGQTPTGRSVTKSENSNAIHESYFDGYNVQIVQSEAVQYYCRTNSSDYPTFAGEKLETINPLW